MRFAWDRSKSDANLRDRGFDFAFASLIFDGPTVEVEDRRRNYGETRIVAIGLADGLHLTVVYTDRAGSRGRRYGETRIVAIGLADGLHLTVVYTDRAGRGSLTRRIVSARRSNRHEHKIYDEAAGHP